MLLFGSFWMLGDKTIVWRTFFPLLPEKVRIGIHPEYTYCIFSLAIAGLAAIGLDSIARRECRSMGHRQRSLRWIYSWWDRDVR